MANTTSGTVTFDKTFAVDDLIAEAYERIGSQVTSGYQLKSARRSLNILFQEWGNRGLHYWEVAETNIDLMILCLGANDMLRGINPKETKNNLEEIIKIAKNNNIKVIIAGMIAPTSYGYGYKKSFDKIFSDLSKKYKLQLIPFLLEGVAQKPEFNLSDGMHPNDQGTIIIGNTLKKAILENL